jgi:hypothetical protein
VPAEKVTVEAVADPVFEGHRNKRTLNLGTAEYGDLGAPDPTHHPAPPAPQSLLGVEDVKDAQAVYADAFRLRDPCVDRTPEAGDSRIRGAGDAPLECGSQHAPRFPRTAGLAARSLPAIVERPARFAATAGDEGPNPARPPDPSESELDRAIVPARLRAGAPQGVLIPIPLNRRMPMPNSERSRHLRCLAHVRPVNFAEGESLEVDPEML